MCSCVFFYFPVCDYLAEIGSLSEFVESTDTGSATVAPESAPPASLSPVLVEEEVSVQAPLSPDNTRLYRVQAQLAETKLEVDRLRLALVRV